MNDVKRVSLVMDGDILLGVVARISQPLKEPKALWRPFTINTDRSFTELGTVLRKHEAIRVIRNAWGIGR